MVAGNFVKKRAIFVMRIVILAFSICFLLSVFSCSPSKEPESPSSHKEEPGNLTGSHELTGSTETEEKDFLINNIEGLPEYFLAEGWVDEENIIGLTGTHCLSVNLLGKGIRSLATNAWSVQISPDGRKLSYLDENGINMINTDGSGQKLFWPDGESGSAFQEGRPAGGVWSPDGEQILCWYEHEWDCDFFYLRPGENYQQALNTAMEGYFLTSPAGWIDDSRLLFNIKASRKKDGTQEYSHGYRGDLAVYDLLAGTYEIITGAEDGEFIEATDLNSSIIVFRRYYGEGADLTHGVMDYSGQVLWEKDLGRVLSLSLSPDGGKMACLVEEEEAIDSNAGVKLVVKEGEQEKEITSFLVGDHLKGPFWSPDGDRILLSFSSRLPAEEPASSFKTSYSTFSINISP